MAMSGAGEGRITDAGPVNTSWSPASLLNHWSPEASSPTNPASPVSNCFSEGSSGVVSPRSLLNAHGQQKFPRNPEDASLSTSSPSHSNDLERILDKLKTPNPNHETGSQPLAIGNRSAFVLETQLPSANEASQPHSAAHSVPSEEVQQPKAPERVEPPLSNPRYEPVPSNLPTFQHANYPVDGSLAPHDLVIRRSQHDVDGYRTLVDKLRDDLRVEVEGFLDVAQTTSQAVGDVLGDNDIGEFVKVPVQLLSLLQQATTRLKDKKQSWDNAQQKLESMERELKEKESSLIQIIGNGPASPRRDDNMSEASYHTSHYASSEDVPPLLHEYHSKAGDLTIWRERLLDFESDHVQELGNRDRRRVKGLTVKTPERAFIEAYFKEREMIIQQISYIRQQAQRLREECTKKDLRPPPLDNYDDLAEIMDRSLRVDKRIRHEIDTVGDIETSRQSPFEFISRWTTEVLRASLTMSPQELRDIINSPPTKNESEAPPSLFQSDTNGSHEQTKHAQTLPPPVSASGQDNKPQSITLATDRQTKWRGEAVKQRYSNPNLASVLVQKPGLQHPKRARSVA